MIVIGTPDAVDQADLTVDVFRAFLKANAALNINPSEFLAEGMIVDIFSLSRLMQIYDALKPTNQAKFNRMLTGIGLLQIFDKMWTIGKVCKA
jgi:hypothetical protein